MCKFKITFSLIMLMATNAFADQSYEARFKCAASPNLTNTAYVSANNDAQALALANEYIRNNTGYQNKGCSVIEVKGNGGSSSRASNSEASYVAEFKCQGSPNLTNSTYVSATSETQAALAAKSYIDNNTGYRNKGCTVTNLRKQ